METNGARAQRRRDALSVPVIVQAAIEILDAEGEEALTFRSLAARLATGPGAIYHHVAHKEGLLAAAAAELVGGVGVGRSSGEQADDGLRELMLQLFDMIDAHPWLGAQLSTTPRQPALLEIFEGVGEGLAPWSVPEASRFDVASALVSYVLGVAAQYAAGARLARSVSRVSFLESVAADWTTSDLQDSHPFVHSVADQLARHDDRDQFAAGVDLILAGVSATYGTAEGSRARG